MAAKRLTFEEALANLEAIVKDVEEGKVGLEDSIRRYEEGMKLLKHCRAILSQAELKIQKLQETADGELQVDAGHTEETT